MYDSRSWFSSRLLVGFCVCVWFFVGASSSLAAVPSNGEIVDGNLFYDNFLYSYSTVQLNSAVSSSYNDVSVRYMSCSGTSWVKVLPADGFRAISFKRGACPWPQTGYYWDNYILANVGSCSSIVKAPYIPPDSDGDGVSDIYDPCPNSSDNYFSHYLVPNSCDGSYYFFQITGECGETKTYFNPKYNAVGEAYQDSMSHPNCTGDPQVKSVTPGQVQGFFDSHSGSTSPAGDGVILDQPVDLTGGSSSSNSTAPAEVTSTDSNTQSVIDAIKLMRDTLKSKLDDVSSDITDRIQVDSDRIVSAIKTTSNNVASLGTSISGVTSAVNSAGTTAHADALALKTAIEGIKSGNATASSSGGMTSDDMRSIIEEDRNLVYTADPGINTDTGLASQGLISSIVGIVGTIQTKVQSIVPDLDVDTSSASPCISGGSITFPDGSSHAVNDLCLDSYENHFVMVGNVLYAFVCIVGVLSIFGMRRE